MTPGRRRLRLACRQRKKCQVAKCRSILEGAKVCDDLASQPSKKLLVVGDANVRRIRTGGLGCSDGEDALPGAVKRVVNVK